MHRYDFKNVRNLSTSFNASTLVCTLCQSEHRVLRRKIKGGDVGMDTPPVFALTDQNFPSMIPAGWEGDCECIKVIQVEHGSLAELVDVLKRALYPSRYRLGDGIGQQHGDDWHG
jgi:hypothetical protein